MRIGLPEDLPPPKAPARSGDCAASNAMSPPTKDPAAQLKRPEKSAAQAAGQISNTTQAQRGPPASATPSLTQSAKDSVKTSADEPSPEPQPASTSMFRPKSIGPHLVDACSSSVEGTPEPQLPAPDLEPAVPANVQTGTSSGISHPPPPSSKRWKWINYVAPNVIDATNSSSPEGTPEPEQSGPATPASTRTTLPQEDGTLLPVAQGLTAQQQGALLGAREQRALAENQLLRPTAAARRSQAGASERNVALDEMSAQEPQAAPSPLKRKGDGALGLSREGSLKQKRKLG